MILIRDGPSKPQPLHFPAGYDNDNLVSCYQLILLEQLFLAHLLRGETAAAVRELQKCVTVYQKYHGSLKDHRSSLHTALGLYAMVMPGCLDNALAQFNAALKFTTEPEQIAFIKLNCVVVQLKLGQSREELQALLESVEPGRMPSKCHSLKASSYCIQGMAALVEGRLTDAKRKLRETVVMANKADLNKLTSSAFLLLAHIFVDIGNKGDALEMVKSAHEIANRIPDISLQIWSSRLLGKLYSEDQPDKATEMRELCEKLNTKITKENELSSNLQENNLLQWLDSEFPSTCISMV